VYSPDAGLRSPLELIRRIWSDVKASRELAWRIFLRDTRAMYRQSFLGYLWIFLPPLLNSLVWVFLNSQKILNVDSGDVPYPVFVLSGNLLWAAFTGSLIGIQTAISSERGMLSKVNLPQEALLMAAVGKSLVNTLVQMTLLVPVFLIFRVPLTTSMLLFPLGLLALILFGVSLGVLLVPFATLMNDVSRLLQVALRFWFFVTPVIYPMPSGGLLRLVARLNPVSPLLTTTRGWLTGAEVAEMQPFLIVCGVAIVLLLVGEVVFKLAMPHIIERLSA
jgi:lipopolysaccharide transport system permease protein